MISFIAMMLPMANIWNIQLDANSKIYLLMLKNGNIILTILKMMVRFLIGF